MRQLASLKATSGESEASEDDSPGMPTPRTIKWEMVYAKEKEVITNILVFWLPFT